MTKNRLEAFSDGVIAILITIMVLELHPPQGSTLASLRPMIPSILVYAASFTFLAIYWNNHHHLLHAIKHVNGAVLWANVHLLFWLSLVPFTTAWVGRVGPAPWPVALYGVVFLLAGVAYFILARTLIALHGRESTLAAAIGADFKGKLSLVIYALAIPIAFMAAWLSCLLYLFVALIWFVPDRRIERTLQP